MRRRRWLQPEFFTSKDVTSLPVEARYTFAGLWVYADDFGRGDSDPRLIKAAVWPLDDEITVDVIEEHLLLLDERNMISLYVAYGRGLFYLPGWFVHQPIHRPSRSSIPPPPADLSYPQAENAPSNPSIQSQETRRRVAGVREEREGGRVRESEREPEMEWEERGVPPPYCPKHPPTAERPQGNAEFPCKECGNYRRENERIVRELKET